MTSVKTLAGTPWGKSPTCALGCLLPGSAAQSRPRPGQNAAAQKETRLLNSSRSPLKDGRRPRRQTSAVSASLGLVTHLQVAVTIRHVTAPAPLNKRETEAQGPAPGSPNAPRAPVPEAELQPHPRRLQQSEELCSAFRRPRPPPQPQNQPSSPPAASPPTANSFPDITKFRLNKTGARSAWLRPGLHLP